MGESRSRIGAERPVGGRKRPEKLGSGCLGNGLCRAGADFGVPGDLTQSMVRTRNLYKVPFGILLGFSLLDTRRGLAGRFQYSGMPASIYLCTVVRRGQVVIKRVITDPISFFVRLDCRTRTV